MVDEYTINILTFPFDEPTNKAIVRFGQLQLLIQYR